MIIILTFLPNRPIWNTLGAGCGVYTATNFFAWSQNVSKLLQARINHHGSVLAVRPATPMPPPPPQPPINGRNGDRGSAPPVRMLAPPSAKSLLDDPNTIKSLMGKEDPAATATYK